MTFTRFAIWLLAGFVSGIAQMEGQVMQGQVMINKWEGVTINQRL